MLTYNAVLENYLIKMKIAYNEKEIQSLSETVCKLYFQNPVIFYTHDKIISLNSTESHYYHKIPDIVECAMHSDDVSDAEFEELITNKFIHWDTCEKTIANCVDFLACRRDFNSKSNILLKSFAPYLTDAHYKMFCNLYVYSNGKDLSTLEMVMDDTDMFQKVLKYVDTKFDEKQLKKVSDMSYKDILKYHLDHGGIDYNVTDFETLNDDACKTILFQTDNMVKDNHLEFFQDSNGGVKKYPELFHYMFYDDNVSLDSFREIVPDMKIMGPQSLAFRVLSSHTDQNTMDKTMHYIHSYVTDTHEAECILHHLFDTFVPDRIRKKVISKMSAGVVEIIKDTGAFQENKYGMQRFF